MDVSDASDKVCSTPSETILNVLPVMLLSSATSSLASLLVMEWMPRRWPRSVSLVLLTSDLSRLMVLKRGVLQGVFSGGDVMIISKGCETNVLFSLGGWCYTRLERALQSAHRWGTRNEG